MLLTGCTPQYAELIQEGNIIQEAANQYISLILARIFMDVLYDYKWAFNSLLLLSIYAPAFKFHPEGNTCLHYIINVEYRKGSGCNKGPLEATQK